ncbi:MAG: hypothetical protein FJ137_05930 [Deltaproteobacteria bacterium]|nr:hypothetical protein [Deltaproteobacteria bacterium]
MRSIHLLAAAIAVVATVGTTGCSYRNEDLNRVVDPYWSKAYFDAENEWYLRSTVVDAPPEHGWISVADGDWLMLEKIRWEITESNLIGWRTYAAAPGSEQENLPGADELYKGQPVAIFDITDHFDIRREFDPTTGEEGNVLSENRDRLWYDRAFIRVNWAANRVPTFKYHLSLEEPGYCGGPCIGTGQQRFLVQAAQAPADPKRWRFEDEYFEITTRHEVAPDILGLVGYYGVAMAGDFSSAIVDVRHSFMKVPKSDYVARPMPGSVALADADGQEVRDERGFVKRIPINDRFGFFGTLGRNTFDANRGMVTSGQVQNASLFNLWKKSRNEDGTIIPMAEREPKPEAVVYYTNLEHPKHLLNASRRVAAQWNKVFRETVWKVNEAKYTGALDGDGIPSDVPAMFVLKENDCNVANVERVIAGLNDAHPELVEQVVAKSRRTVVNDEVPSFDGTIESIRARFDEANDEIDNLQPNGLGSKGQSFTALQAQETQALHDLERICSALEYFTGGDMTMGRAAPEGVEPFLYQRLGDTRYSMMNLVVGDFQSGWLGLGPPYADPQTGETISGTANIALAMLDRYATRAAQYVSILNGETNDLDLQYGFDVAKYTEEKLLENSKLVTRRASQQTRDEAARAFESRRGNREVLKEVAPGRAHERMSRVVGTELEQQLITQDDVALFGAVNPRDAATASLDDDMLNSVSPLRNPKLMHLGRELEQRAIRMGQRAADPPEMINNFLIGQAVAYKDMSYAERFKKLREDIYVAVQLHEVGHNTGMFHNFAASTDALNYGRFFWEIQDLPADIDDAIAELSTRNDSRSTTRIEQLENCKAVIANAGPDFESQAMTAQDCLRQSEGVYSSIMDYHGNWNADFNGLGPYDFAANKFAYGQLLEVFPTENLRADIDQPGEMKKSLFYNDWRDIPEMFNGGDRGEKVATMHDRTYVSMDWDASSTRAQPLPNEVPYRFGWGAYPEPMVKVFDYGPDTRSNTAFKLTSYYQNFFFSHFARNRLWDFDAVSGAIGADDGVMADFTEKMQWFFFYSASDPDFVGSYAYEDFLATTEAGLNHFAHVLAEPNSGNFHTLPAHQLFSITNLPPEGRTPDPLDIAIPWSNLGFCDAQIINTAGFADGQDDGAAPDRDVEFMADPQPGYASGNVPLGEGRPFFVGFTDDYVDFYIRYVGHYWTKLYAIINLGMNSAYFPRVDADSDWRLYDVSWYRLFPREVSRIYGALVTQDDLALGGFLDDNGRYVRPDLLPVDGSVDTTGMTRVLPQIAINHNYYAYLLANVFLDSPTDDTLNLTKTMQIAVDGGTDDVRAYDDAEARDAVECPEFDARNPEHLTNPPDCKTALSFTHPTTGMTYRALKVGDTPVAFNLVKRLNVLKQRFQRLDACNRDLQQDGTLDDEDVYCACITNIGGGRDNSDYLQTCLDDYVTVMPGESVQAPALSGFTNLREVEVTCTPQDLQNRRDSAREAVDDLTDYVNDLRTYNKLVNNF